MDRLGADTGELLDAATALADTAGSLDRTRSQLRTRLTATPWSGSDRDAFLADWRTHDASLAAAATTLRHASRSLRTQAGEQDHASGADGPGAPPQVAAPPTHHSATPAPAAPPGAPPPPDAAMPRRVDAWEGGVGISTGIGGSVAASLVTEDLPGPRSTVTIANESAATGDLGAGSFAELWGGSHEAGSGGEAAASVSGGVRVERTWIVSDPEAAAFGRARLIDTGIDAATTGGGLAVLGDAIDAARHLVGAEPPAPHITTSLLAVGVGASGSVAGGPVGGRARGTSEVAVGIRERASGTSAVVRWNAEGDVGLTNDLLRAFGLPSAAKGAVTTEIEVLPASGGHRSVLVEVQMASGSTTDLLHVHTVYREADLRGHLDRALDAFGAGDPGRALRELERASGAVVGSTATVAAGSVHTTTRGGSISAAAGASVDGDARLVHSVTELGPPSSAPTGYSTSTRTT